MAANDDASKEPGRGPSAPTDPTADTGRPVPQPAPVAPVQSTTAGAADRFDGLNFQDVNALLAVIKAQAQAKK
jgi:hypothetical protein